jgi:hypothetical protein
MELINIEEVTELDRAKELIAELQERLIVREQCLEDLARAVEIAEVSRQFQIMTSFREAAEEQLKDKIDVPMTGANQDMKVQIFQ